MSDISSYLGVSLKAEHVFEILDLKPALGWFEVHTENYMNAGGPNHHYLSKVHADYDLSFHGVGLSIGSEEGIDKDHLARVRQTIDRYEPFLTSEHMSWSSFHGQYMADLLPVRYDTDVLNGMVDQISLVQDTLKRSILVENPSQYLWGTKSEFTEPAFINELVKRTGCGILLDVNNIYVSATNLGFEAKNYLAELDLGPVGEIHLAGHAVKEFQGEKILIDDHGDRVCDAVWDLYDSVIARTKAVPTLIEWDSNIPAFSVFMEEAEKAGRILEKYSEDAHARAS